MNYRTLAILLAFIIAPFVNASEPSSSALDDWAPRLVDDDLMPSDAFVDGTAKWLEHPFAGRPQNAPRTDKRNGMMLTCCGRPDGKR